MESSFPFTSPLPPTDEDRRIVLVAFDMHPSWAINRVSSSFQSNSSHLQRRIRPWRLVLACSGRCSISRSFS
jgi:hypothetical protein